MKPKINLRISLIISILYLVIQIPSFILSIFCNVSNVNAFYYSFIVINFVFSLIILFFNKNKNNLITSIALIFTLIADTFLVLLNNQLNYTNQVIAMFSFNFTQIAYYIKLLNYRDNLHIKLIDYFRITIILLIIIISLIIIKRFDLLAIISVTYIGLLFVNILESIKYFKVNYLFTIGLIFFFCCDILIGLANCSDYLTIKEDSIFYKLLNTNIDLAWFFYYPSQIFIILSCLFPFSEKINLKKISN